MKKIDARDYEPKEKHLKIFEMFFNLDFDKSMLIINDHDPKPLYYQLLFEYPDTFEWTYKTKGPEIYEVILKKVSELPSSK